MKQYPHLFKELRIGKRMVKNRVVLAPMGEGMANPDGSMSEQFICYYTEFAKGGCGIITPGVICVDYPYGKPEKNIFRIDSTKNIRDLNRLAERIHRYEALFIPQIHHAGGQTDCTLTEGEQPRCVSDMDVDHIVLQLHRPVGPQKELTTEEIKGLVQKFVQASVNCQKAKCDGVALHSAHGYLVNQFLSPALNARKDEYGGSFDNRVRFGTEVIQGIRAACGPNFIIGARIPGAEWVKNGLTFEECDEIARRYEAAGCNYLDVSLGASNVFSNSLETERYPQGNRVYLAERIKKAVAIPVGAVGVLREPEFCEGLVAEGRVDLIYMGRGLIADPYWPEKARNGRAGEIRPCLSCLDGCTNRMFNACALGCAVNPMAGREFDIGPITKTDSPKKVLVIGGGPGGMQAAITAAGRGNQVTLMEKKPELGGQLNLAFVPPHKDLLRSYRDWLVGELHRKGVSVKLNCEADITIVEDLRPDLIIAATGALPIVKIPVTGLEHTVQAWDVLGGKVTIPSKVEVIIIGGGIVGCEVAELLLEYGNSIRIVEMLPEIANGLELIHKLDLIKEFETKKVILETNATVKLITADSVSYRKDNQDLAAKADITVLAVGQTSAGWDLIYQLREKEYEVAVIGDARLPAKIIDATTDGLFAGLNV
jgi:2,4-dienoyl-CoA reductase-like NADH-dependent reductase (Old Yellow Enzyme family)/thioredoxin reductase